MGSCSSFSRLTEKISSGFQDWNPSARDGCRCCTKNIRVVSQQSRRKIGLSPRPSASKGPPFVPQSIFLTPLQQDLNLPLLGHLYTSRVSEPEKYKRRHREGNRTPLLVCLAASPPTNSSSSPLPPFLSFPPSLRGHLSPARFVISVPLILLSTSRSESSFFLPFP